MDYPENSKEIINRLVEVFSLDGKEKKELGIFNMPGAILSELVVRYKKEIISKEEEVIKYLTRRMNISEGEAEKIAKIMDKKIFSEMRKGKEPDKYREQID